MKLNNLAHWRVYVLMSIAGAVCPSNSLASVECVVRHADQDRIFNVARANEGVVTIWGEQKVDLEFDYDQRIDMASIKAFFNGEDITQIFYESNSYSVKKIVTVDAGPKGGELLLTGFFKGDITDPKWAKCVMPPLRWKKLILSIGAQLEAGTVSFKKLNPEEVEAIIRKHHGM